MKKKILNCQFSVACGPKFFFGGPVLSVTESQNGSVGSGNYSRSLVEFRTRGDCRFLSQIQEESARGWLAEVFARLKHDDLIRVVVTLWTIWHAKRKAIHENLFQSPLSTHYFVDRFIGDLSLVSPGTQEKQENQIATPKWIPPPSGSVKINVDATLSKNTTIAACAAVARYEIGDFLGASGVVFEGVTEAEIAEALACHEGLALASDINTSNIRLASDFLTVVKNIHGDGIGRYGHIIREIKVRILRLCKDGFCSRRPAIEH